MGSVSANRTPVASSAQRARMATSVWRMQITLAAKVSPLLVCQVKEGGRKSLHIPPDWWPRRKGAGHVPPPAFE